MMLSAQIDGDCRSLRRYFEKLFEVLAQAIKEDQLWWTQLSDLKFWSNAVAQQYRVQSIPQNYLIDPDGIIIAKDLRGRDLQTKLCELLGCE